MHPYDGVAPKSILIMDNCSIHHVQDVLDLLQSCGILVVFLPPYSPDFTPIESAFSFVKQYLKKHDEVLQAMTNPIPLIQSAFDSITPILASSWITDCGYSYWYKLWTVRISMLFSVYQHYNSFNQQCDLLQGQQCILGHYRVLISARMAFWSSLNSAWDSPPLSRMSIHFPNWSRHWDLMPNRFPGDTPGTAPLESPLFGEVEALESADDSESCFFLRPLKKDSLGGHQENCVFFNWMRLAQVRSCSLEYLSPCFSSSLASVSLVSATLSLWWDSWLVELREIFCALLVCDDELLLGRFLEAELSLLVFFKTPQKYWLLPWMKIIHLLNVIIITKPLLLSTQAMSRMNIAYFYVTWESISESSQ